MTFDEIWNAMLAKNPDLSDDKTALKITVGNFRRALEQSYDQGTIEGKKQSKSPGLFDGIFR